MEFDTRLLIFFKPKRGQYRRTKEELDEKIPEIPLFIQYRLWNGLDKVEALCLHNCMIDVESKCVHGKESLFVTLGLHSGQGRAEKMMNLFYQMRQENQSWLS